MSETNNTTPNAKAENAAEFFKNALADSTFKPVTSEVENTGIPSTLGIDPHAEDPASTPPSTNVAPESGTQEEVRVQLKELAKYFSCVSTKQTENGVELYLFTQTKVPHPTFVETIRQKIANKEDVGKNYILTGATIEEILENLATNGL